MRARKVDTTAKTLVAAAKKLGAQVLPLNGVIDAVLLYNGSVLLVDWKSPGGTLTPDQAKLVAAGWPIAFISDEAQLLRVLRC